MAKLTLSVDDQVISRAKHYAKVRGLSVSEMVETYLAAVAEPASSPADYPPVLRSVRGILKKANKSEYLKHLESRYR